MTIFNKLIIASCLTTSILCADTFSLNNVSSNNQSKVQNNTKDLISTGYGISPEKALNNAFKSAIQQYVGVVVDSETILKNNNLIKDEVLTASNGFIKSYDKISSNNNDGLFEVTIKATVQSQKVLQKIESLNIATISFRTNIRGQDLIAEISTKKQSKEDAEKILKKAYNEFFSINSIQEMLKIKIKSAKLDKDKVKGNRIPMNIDYTLSLDYDIYLQKVKKLEQTFKNLGAKLHEEVDFPYIGESSLEMANRGENFKKNLDIGTNIGFMKKYGTNYKLDMWIFPKTWKDIHPFHNDDRLNSIRIYNLYSIVLKIKDINNTVIFVNQLKNKGEVNGLKYIIYGNSIPKIYSSSFGSHNDYKAKIIAPFLLDRDRIDYNYILNYSITKMIDISSIDKIKDISIELKQK
jgi:hypothetical protein